MYRALRVGMTCLSVVFVSEAAFAQPVTPVFFGGSGDQRGMAIVLAPDGLYVAGSLAAGPRGFANKYSIPPVTAPVWSVLALAAATAFDGLAVLAPNVFAVGGAFPPACGAVDGAGGTEWKMGLTRLQTSGAVTGCQSNNVWAYRGTENYSGVATQTEGGNPFFYVVGYAENCGGNMLPILSKHNAAGGIVAQVSEPGAPACLGYAANYAVSAHNGSIYIAAHSQLTGLGEDNVPRPVLMKYDAGPARVWKRRDMTTPGIFRGVAGIGSAVYVVGQSYAPGVPNSEQYMISKYDEAGALAWTRISGGAGSDSLTGVIGMGGRVFAVGYTRSQGAGGADAVILEIDPVTGGTIGTTLFGGAQDDFANGVVTDGAYLYVVGETRSFATPAGNVVGQNDMVILRVGCGTIAVDPASLPAGTAGTPYSQALTLAGGTGTITWSLTGVLPNGLTFNTTTGVLSGIPTQTGSFPITVGATDANGCAGSRAYTLVINCQAIAVNPATIPNATAGAAYSQTFTAAGAIGTTTWTLTGALPAGLTLNSGTGVLSGTPTEIGSFPFTVTTTDANGCVGSRAYTLVVDRAGPFVPTALAADAGGNGVFEAAETAIIAPSWRNDTGAAETVTGTVTGFTGPGTPTYSILDNSAAYGAVAAGTTASCSAAGGDCYALRASAPNPRPAIHWDATFTETLSNSDAKTWRLHVGDSFTDVLRSSPFYRFVETLLHKSVTGGCNAASYCPASATTRDQMAVFVLVAREPAGYAPPACGATPVFADVPVTSGFCRWIEELARRGVVGGCGNGNYCPSAPATREQMAVFVLRALDPALAPPPCGVPMFGDVPASSPFCKWIEELARRGVVSGCGAGNYCPTGTVTREQMSVFLAVTFGLTLYGP